MSDERTPGSADPDRPANEQTQQQATPPAWPAPPDPASGGVAPSGMPPLGPPAWPEPPPPEPQRGPSGVHPLTVGRAFSVGWSLFRFRWRTLIGVALAVMIPVYLVQALATLYATSTVEAWSAAVQATYAEAIREGREIGLADLPPVPWEAILAAIASGILLGLAGAFLAAALIHVIGWTYGGNRRSAADALRATLRRLPSLLGASLLVGLTIALVVFGGMTLMLATFVAVSFEGGLLALLGLIVFVSTMVAVVFIGLRWQLYTHAIMLEGAGAIGSLGRSWRLVAGSTWRVLGYLLLLMLVLMLAGIVGGIISLMLFGLNVDMTTGRPLPLTPVQTIGQTVVGGAVTLLVMPFHVAVMTLLYYDLRWRAGEPIGPPPA
jgi:hypothetical protein